MAADDVRDVQPMEEYEEEYQGRRITAGPVIAVVVVVLLLSITGFYYFYGAGEVEDVKVIFGEEYKEDDNIVGVMFRVFVTPVGVREFEGSGTVDIFYDGKLEHSSSVDITDGKENVRIPYRDFVVGNGDYEIKCTVGGKSSSFEHYIYHIPDIVNVTLTVDGDDYDQFLKLTMWPHYPLTLTKYIQIADIDKNYRYTYKVTDENGYVVSGSYLSYEMDTDNKIVSKDLEMDLMGNYTVEVSLETLLMKEGAAGRTVTRDPFTIYINRKPIIEVSASSTSVRPGTEVTFSLKSDDLDSNGEVLYYNLVLPDADGDDLKEYVTVYKEGPTTRVKYTFDTIGEHKINFTAADNGPMVTTGGDLMIYQEFSSIVTIIVEVKWLS